MIIKVLKGKKIFVICPHFIDYNKAIKDEIENLGGEATIFNDRPYNGVYDFFKKINLNFVKFYQYLKWKMIKIDFSKFDLLFVIIGEHVPQFVLEKFKRAGAEMVMYQWDSVRNYNYLNLSGLFDRICTFDKEDSVKYGLEYVPLFYRKEYSSLQQKKTDEKIALFVGTFQKKRFETLIQLSQKLNEIGIQTVLKVRIPYYYYFKLLLKGSRLEKKYLVFKDISFVELLRLYEKSDIIIDIVNENQTGLTMRTFEALAANRILLTNNLSILDEPFYNSKNIKFINGTISQESFMDKIVPNLVHEYSLDNWIIKILG